MKFTLTIKAFLALLVALLILLGVAVMAYRSLDALIEPGYDGRLAVEVRQQVKWQIGLVIGASALVAGASAALALQQINRRRERLALIDSERLHRELSTQLTANNAELLAFTYTVSHDLRAPLRAIEGFSNALIEDEGPRLSQVGIAHARRIGEAAQRMDQLIRDLLSYSRVGHDDFHLHEVHIESAVRDSLAQLADDIRTSGAEIRRPDTFPTVHGHHALLMQLVVNLLSNAIKFVPKSVQPIITISTTQVGNHVTLTVSDNGIGIAQEHQERVFRVFERLHGVESYPGTGIGLAIVRRAAERMGGRVTVQSAPGEGCVFRVELVSYHQP